MKRSDFLKALATLPLIGKGLVRTEPPEAAPPEPESVDVEDWGDVVYWTASEDFSPLEGLQFDGLAPETEYRFTVGLDEPFQYRLLGPDGTLIQQGLLDET